MFELQKLVVQKLVLNLFGAAPVCYGCHESFCTPFVIPNNLKLQKKIGNTWQTINIKPGHHHTFNLVANNTYRVVASYGKSVGFITNICSYYGGQTITQEIGETIRVASPSYYSAPPIPIGTISDFSGVPNDNIIEYVSGQSIYLNAINSIGETAYQVQVLQTAPSSGWNSTGWVLGTAGYIDLLDVWKGPFAWRDFTPGTYSINLALKNACSGWRSITIILTICENCKTGEFEEASLDVNLFPNPASYEITLEGVEDMEGDVKYFIQDFSGKMVSKGRITNPTMPIGVSDLVNGMYVINIVSDNNRVTKKFTIVK